MKILFHYIREADIITAISNKILGEGPLLSIINAFSDIEFDKVKCIMYVNKEFINDAYANTTNRALYRNESELFSNLKEEFRDFKKRDRLFITEFFKENIKCDLDFSYIDSPEDSSEFHPDFYNQIIEDSKTSEIYAIYDSYGNIISDFFIHELKDNLKIVVNTNDFPKGVPKHFDFSRDILGTSATTVQSFIKNLTLLKESEEIPKSFEELITKDPEMVSLINFANFIAKYDDNVLLLGDTGTGKEVFAKAIHNASNRKDKPFVAVNCAAIPTNLFESELFGSVKGGYYEAQDKAGLIEKANGGTLFLDEIGDTVYEHQTKLLRVIQEKKITRIGSNRTDPVDFRLICATNKNLVEVLDIGFRSDLYYRINKISIKLPALKERSSEDIELLLEYFLKVSKKTYLGFDNIHFTSNTIKLLKTYQWPGNIRELQGFVSKAFIRAAFEEKDIDKEIMNKCLDLNIPEKQHPPILKKESSIIENETEIIDKYRKSFSVELIDDFKFTELFESIKKHYLIEALKISKTEVQAGHLIGYSQPTVNRLAKQYNLKK